MGEAQATQLVHRLSSLIIGGSPVLAGVDRLEHRGDLADLTL
jgi:hypothetical protein